MFSIPPEMDHDLIERETGLPNPMIQGFPGNTEYSWPNGRPSVRVLRAVKRFVLRPFRRDVAGG